MESAIASASNASKHRRIVAIGIRLRRHMRGLDEFKKEYIEESVRQQADAEGLDPRGGIFYYTKHPSDTASESVKTSRIPVIKAVFDDFGEVILRTNIFLKM